MAVKLIFSEKAFTDILTSSEVKKMTRGAAEKIAKKAVAYGDKQSRDSHGYKKPVYLVSEPYDYPRANSRVYTGDEHAINHNRMYNTLVNCMAGAKI